MRKTIEFQSSTNNSALLTRSKPGAYEDLVLTDTYRKYRHQFAPGKTKIRLLPAMSAESHWLLQIPALLHANGRHCHPRVIKAGAESAYDMAYKHMKKKYPTRLFSRANKAGIRLLPTPLSACWAVLEDDNGIRLRLLLASFYDGKGGASSGLGNTICSHVLEAGEDTTRPGHPLNHMDGTSILVERIGGSDSKFPSYRTSLSEDRSPLKTLLDKVTDVEFNALCPINETIRILEPEEEWRLLAKVVGADLVAEILSAQEIGKSEQHSQTESISEEAAVADDDFRDFPTKWEI